MMSSVYQNILLGHSKSLKFQMIEINYHYIELMFQSLLVVETVGMETAYWFCVVSGCLYMYIQIEWAA